MQEFFIHFIEQFGYLGVALLIAVENIFPPIPSEVILTFSGFMTTYTNLKEIFVVVWATAGAVVGAVVLYYLGRWFNAERLEKWLGGKWGRRLHFKPQDVYRANEWFQKRGSLTVFFCRCIPIVRSLISIPAGMSRMSMPKFLLLTTLGSAIWNTVLVYLGAFMGESWEKVVEYFDIYGLVAIGVILLLLVAGGFYFYKKRVKTKK